MKERLESLRRIERMQRRLRDLSRWRLSRLARERDKLIQTHEEMLTAISDGLLAYGGAAAAGTRRVRALEIEMSAARIIHDAQAKHALELGARSKLADRAVEVAATRHRARGEQKGLEELIAWTLLAANSGPRKP